MSQENFPLYLKSQPIYGDSGEIILPKAVVRKTHQTDKARLLWNLANDQESWFPEYIFSYHWHCVSVDEMAIFLSIPDDWAKKKQEFFV